MFTKENKQVGDNRYISKDFFRPKSSVAHDGDENSSDDINTDDNDDHYDIRLRKAKRTPLLFLYQNG